MNLKIEEILMDNNFNIHLDLITMIRIFKMLVENILNNL